MNSLVDYDSSDDDSVDQTVDVSPNTPANALSIDSPKVEQQNKSLKNREILQKCLNLRKKYAMKEEFFDENYYMKLELELGSNSVQDTDFVKSEKPIIRSERNSNFNIPPPQSVSAVAPIDLNTNFLDIVDDDELPNPHTFNLNLIKEQKISEIPANCLVSGRLLTVGEQAGIKRKQNIDIGTVTAKAICMDDLTADRPIDMKPGLSADELSKFRSIKDNEPDKNSSRQHQITWLAHKAKEREFELMNRWSENSFSQKESRSKYGF